MTGGVTPHDGIVQEVEQRMEQLPRVLEQEIRNRLLHAVSPDIS